MTYVLKQFDTPLLAFSASTDTSVPEIEILWIDEEHRALLPLDLTCSPEGIRRWLRRRTIPKNRAYVHDFLAKCNLNLNRPLNIINVCKGLSLNDCYWVVQAGDETPFAKVNLYENRLSNVLAQLAFTGYGSSVRTSLLSSPEFTTNGMLRKCWRRLHGTIYLYKGGTEGASNAGYEPYSEFYAAQVAAAMQAHAIAYGLSRWKGVLCSTCALFTSQAQSYLPIGHLVPSGGMEAVRAYYDELGPAFADALHEMLVFDAVICNVDRHFGNFGVMVDNRTNRIAAPAPLFDHGNSLFNFAGRDAWESDASLEAYLATLAPSVYDDFIGTARRVLTPRLREQVRHLLTFRFQKHPRYNLPEQRLRRIERQIQKRAGLLLQ